MTGARRGSMGGSLLLVATPALAEASVLFVAWLRRGSHDWVAHLLANQAPGYLLSSGLVTLGASTLLSFLVWMAGTLPWRRLRCPLVGGAAVLAVLPLLSAAVYAMLRTLPSATLVVDGASILVHDRSVTGLTGAMLVTALAGFAAFLARNTLRELDGDRSANPRGPSGRTTLSLAAGTFLLFDASSVFVYLVPDSAQTFRTEVHSGSSLLPASWLVHPAVLRENAVFRWAAGDVDLGALAPVSEVGTYLNGLSQLPSGRRPNVLVVLLEGVPAPGCGSFGYPRRTTTSLDALASEGVLFDRAWSVANASKDGQTSILASVLPMRGNADSFLVGDLDYPRVLCWEVFRALGYRTALISAQDETWLGMSRFQLLGRRPPDVYLHSPDFKEGELFSYPRKRDEETVNRSAFRFLEDSTREERPFFLVVNYQRTHYPYTLPKWRHPAFPPLAALDEEYRKWRAGDLPLARNNFDSALAYVDEQLGALERKVEALGLRESTLITVLADHGQGFEIGWEPNAHSLEDAFVHIPWVFRYPGILAPRRVKRDVSSIDVFPTVLGILGVPPCPAWQGEDVLSQDRPPHADRPIFSGSLALEHRWIMLSANLRLEIDLLKRQWEVRERDDQGTAPPLSRDDPRAARLVRLFLKVHDQHHTYYEDRPTRTRFLPPVVPSSAAE